MREFKGRVIVGGTCTATIVRCPADGDEQYPRGMGGEGRLSAAWGNLKRQDGNIYTFDKRGTGSGPSGSVHAA